MPSVVAGGIMNMPAGGIWASLKGLTMLVAFVSQIALIALAAYFVNETVSTPDEKVQATLNDPRPEHKARRARDQGARCECANIPL